jgi:hypothetical protein
MPATSRSQPHLELFAREVVGETPVSFAAEAWVHDGRLANVLRETGRVTVGPLPHKVTPLTDYAIDMMETVSTKMN